MDGGQSTSTDWQKKHTGKTVEPHSRNIPVWMRPDRHLDVQLQDVCVRLQQLTHVGFGTAKVAVDKLLDVAVAHR